MSSQIFHSSEISPPGLFASEFFNCLISSETSNRFTLSDYFENAYDRNYDFCESLPYLLSQRDVSVTPPYPRKSPD